MTTLTRTATTATATAAAQLTITSTASRATALGLAALVTLSVLGSLGLTADRQYDNALVAQTGSGIHTLALGQAGKRANRG